MATFVDIQKAAEGIVSTSIDAATPAGHFVATAKIHGHATTYLLEGVFDSPDAVIKGHVIYTEDHGKLASIGYRDGGLVGGYYLGRVQSFEETFAQMV